MKFTLVYRGPLKSNGSGRDKHAIREKLSLQLARLYEQPPFNEHYGSYGKLLNTLEVPHAPATNVVGGGHPISIMLPQSHEVLTELDILLLRPEKPGVIIVSGDLDNRLKTLFDALRAPKLADEIPASAAPTTQERPLFCLLDDDSQIVRVNVETDLLLELVVAQTEVQLFIRVTTRLGRVTLDNMSFG